jgi:hypothetical protein
MGEVPVLDVKDVTTLPEDPGLGGILNPEALAQVKATDSSGQRFVLQSRSGGVVHAGRC